jgi:hypothetical protein
MSDAIDDFDDKQFDVLGMQSRDADRRSEAIRTQDELREKSEDWSGEREVKRWRTRRSSS